MPSIYEKKSTSTKEKQVGKLYFIKIQFFGASKNSIEKVKRKPSKQKRTEN